MLASMIDALVGRSLVVYARDCIREALGGPAALPPTDAALLRPGAAFVTLRRKRDGRLHGCIGSLEARRSLVADVAANAVAAALEDPRAPSIALGDVDGLEVEVSVLSALEPLPPQRTELDALETLAARKGGVVLSWRGRRATFLPQMWERMPEPREFLSELKQKAGFPADFWEPDVQLSHYTAEIFADA